MLLKGVEQGNGLEAVRQLFRTCQPSSRNRSLALLHLIMQWPNFDMRALDTPFMSQDRPPLAIAITATVDGIRGLRRCRLVIAQKAKLRLSPEVATALASRTADHRLTASGFYPCSIDREFLYGYAADGYRSPLWICAAYDGDPVLVHRQRGTVLYFHQAHRGVKPLEKRDK